MNIFNRRQFLISANVNRYVKPQVKMQPQKLPPLAIHSLILANMFQEFVELYPKKSAWTFNQKKYAILLLESYDIAVTQIEDEDLKELFKSLMEQPLDIEYPIL